MIVEKAVSSIIDLYPTIKKATIEIAYDNNCVHRGRTEETMLADAAQVLTTRSITELEAVELELKALDEEELMTLCCGEQGVIEATSQTERLLTDIFEAI